MPKTLLAIGAHYDDCVFGIPGILLQAARKHYRVVLLTLIGDYSNWAPTKGRDQELVKGTAAICRDYGAEMRFLTYASHKFEVTNETKKAVAEVVADVKPDIGFHLWFHDRHRDHEIAAALSQVALQHGDRLLEKDGYRPARSIFAYDNGPRHTIGFEPNTYVDITNEWPTAKEWLGRLMALQAGKPFDRTATDGATQAKEALASYRGFACGVKYAEAVWAVNARAQEIL